MSVLIGPRRADATIMEVDATSKAHRMLMFNSLGERWGARRKRIGSYFVPINIRQTHTLTGTDAIFALRNGPPSRIVVLITRILLYQLPDLVASAALDNVTAVFDKFWGTALLAGGNQLVPCRSRSRDPLSAVTDVRVIVNNNASLTGGISYYVDGRMATTQSWTNTIANGVPQLPNLSIIDWDDRGGQEIELLCGEGLALRITNGISTSTTWIGYVAWDECLSLLN